MALKLYCSLTSPYARRVRLATRLLNMSGDIEEEVVDPFSSPAELLDSNPLSKIPVLRGDDGFVLPDSHLILSYLLEQRGRAMPAASGDWAEARLLAIVEGLTDASTSIVMENRRPESIRHPAHIDRQSAAITRCLQALAEPPALDRFESAEPVPLSLATALAYMDFRLSWLQWREQQPKLAQWLDALTGHPAMQETRPPDNA